MDLNKPDAHDGGAAVLPMGRRLWDRQQDRRRALVRDALLDAREWIIAGLEGEIPLAEAVCEADHALSPAMREILQSELVG